MIDLKALRDAPGAVRAALARRRDTYGPLLDRVLALDAQRRELLTRAEKLRAERNAASEEVARLKRQNVDTSDKVVGLRAASDSIKELDQQLRDVETALHDASAQIPNLTLPDVPPGDATANTVVRTHGTPRQFAFTPRPHWELGESLGILDLPRGAKVAGSGFPVFCGAGARLIRALIGLFIDTHTRDHGYVEVAPPLLVNRDTAFGTGQLPDLESNMYVTADGLYLVPTAEVPVTNLHREEILAGEQLPRAYVAYTPCFRREAGAAGKDTRGILRVHQFDKVELVRLVRPEDSPAEHEKLLGHAERMLQVLELPYRVVLLAAGDTGFASAKTFDLEAWAAGVGTWLEVSSASTFTDFQARRASIRYRPRSDAKPEFVHTLNASALAFPRIIAALLENNQEADGSVSLPKALVSYLGTERLSAGAT